MPTGILIVIDDDMGWPHRGATLAPSHFPSGHYFADLMPGFEMMPALSTFAQNGVAFTAGYAMTAKCDPTWAQTLTGLHARDLALLPGGAATWQFVDPLRAAGWRTYHAGKWWATLCGPRAARFDVLGPDAAQLGRVPGSLASLFAFISQARADGVPWLAIVAPMLPHEDWDPPAIYRAPFEDLVPPQGFLPLGAMDSAGDIPRYWGNVHRLDGEVYAPILGFLAEEVLLDDTLIIAFADNGTCLPKPCKGDSACSNGQRTIVVMHGPGIPETGLVNQKLVSTGDLGPTVLDYAGLVGAPPIPGGYLEARSLRPLAEAGGALPWRSYQFEQQGTRVVRRADGWSLYASGAPTTAASDKKLFGGSDVYEETNLKDVYPPDTGIRAELRAVLNNWWVNRLLPPDQ